jgi:glycosyltransferase involved in cell wall biosynthesis
MYEAIQKGFKKSTGDIMAYINSDDMYHPNAFNTVVEAFALDDNIEWVIGNGTIFDEHGRVYTTKDKQNRQKWSKYLYWIGKYQWIQQESCFWKRSLWDKSGSKISTELKLAGDMELWCRFFHHTYLYPLNFQLAGFRKRRTGNKANENMSSYKLEAENVIDDNYKTLDKNDIKKLKKIKLLLRFYNTLQKLRIFNHKAFYRHFIEAQLDLPKEIVLDRQTQKLKLD